MSLMKKYDEKDDILIFIIFEEYKRKLIEILKIGLTSASREQFDECPIRLFAAVSAAMFVVCQADKPPDIIRTKFSQIERKSETSFS